MSELFPFLKLVDDVESFDEKLTEYVQTAWVQRQYDDRFGCTGIDLTNTTDLYARFTTSVVCNAIIQNSRASCSLTEEQSIPLCADSCTQYAQSEQRIIENDSLCGGSPEDTEAQIRADFTWCTQPFDSLKTSKCISGIENENENCGFGASTLGLCGYCGIGGANSTDTCCYNSQAEERCAGIVLPKLTSSISLTPSSATPSATATSDPQNDDEDDGGGLSAGAIAGIVVGSVVGLALLIGLIFLILLCLRRRRPASQDGSVFNQPNPARKGTTSMIQTNDGTSAPPGFEVLPGGRIARMNALEGHSGDSPPRGGTGYTTGTGYSGPVGAAGYGSGSDRHNGSSSSSFGYSPASDTRGGVLRPPPNRRQGSLSSSSALGEDPNSPMSNAMSSPQGISSQQSEQLPFFKDYYSQDEIHPGDRVATLWAYQPRAGDEFMLERGDMLKVVGIWDDGWATGVMIDERADEWEAKKNMQRDSGVSNTSGVRQNDSPPVTGEIKAFPLVCVCLPEHWRKTIEGDGSTDVGSNGGGPPPGA